MFLTIHDWSLPIKNPVFLFSLLLLIVLLVPPLLQRYKMPGLVGMIIMGAVLGPHGVNLLERGEGIQVLASAGLLYIMFWAGLEINMVSFLKNKHKSLAFGLLTFGLPLTIGGLCSHYLLGFSPLASLLMASMFSTHTLISYPIVNRLRIVDNEAVTVAVGGTIITDTLALLILAAVAGVAQGTISGWFWGKLLVSLALYTYVVFKIMPRIARWFFRRVESDLTYQYVFVLALVFICGLLAELAGVEAIIGAFAAGLVLNRLIPHSSPLMERIEFVGNALFIPAFLFSVGMLVNLQVFFDGKRAIVMALTLTAVALLTKWLAAWATQRYYKYSVEQRNLMFGLSSSHAAATIAIILIGYQVKLFDLEVLNAIIFLILVTCLVSTFVTDKVARRLALAGKTSPATGADRTQRILVPFANPATVTSLIDFAILIKAVQQKEPIYPLSVILDDQNVKEKVRQAERMMEPVLRHAIEHQATLNPINRVDVSSVSGILRATKELLATDIVVGWRPKTTTTEKLFGTVLDNLLEDTSELIFVTHFTRSPFLFRQVKAVLPLGSHLEPGFGELVHRLENICLHLRAPLHVLALDETAQAVRHHLDKQAAVRFQTTPFDTEDWPLLHERVSSDDDLLLLVSARKEGVSYDSSMDRIPGYLAEQFSERSFVLTYLGL